MAKQESHQEKLNPEKVILNKIQAKRFSALTSIDEKKVLGMSIVQLSEMHKFHFDPKLFMFMKICGKVVKKDPVTSVEYPVPFATVHVEDVDLNIITYCPPGYPWVWHFPFLLRKEEIATTKTDACGNFCLWVPRFDIDWILKWRTLHICYPVHFLRPHIDDYLTKRPPLRIPDPEPNPYIRERYQLHSFAGVKAEKVQSQILKAQNLMQAGMDSKNVDQLANRRLFNHEVPAPLPREFQQALSGEGVIASKKATPADAIRTRIAEQLRIDVKSDMIRAFDCRKLIGPFHRCFEIKLPVWQPIIDVPDITFHVTQDINADGIEETIYSEGFFETRWNSGQIPDVTLVASSLAKESQICNVPVIPCGNKPALIMAGMMPLDNPLHPSIPGGKAYFNSDTGYALRPNQPNLTGQIPVINGLDRGNIAETPFYGTIGFFGCVDLNNAKYYRIMQIMEGGALHPVTSLSWNNYTLIGGTAIPIVADINGWYPVEPIHPVTLNPIPRNSLALPTLILVWPTPYLQKTSLLIELGDSSKISIGYSETVNIQSDNTVPTLTYTKWSWKFASESDSKLRDLHGMTCPMIKRGASPKDIEVVFEVSISANHLLMAKIYTSGCGDGNNFTPETDPANNPAHWHANVNDNSVILYQRYSLKAGNLPGCYSFITLACSRSITPAAVHGENLIPVPDWYSDDYDIYTNPYLAVAVVNDNE
jgi:hypothetical protein